MDNSGRDMNEAWSGMKMKANNEMKTIRRQGVLRRNGQTIWKWKLMSKYSCEKKIMDNEWQKERKEKKSEDWTMDEKKKWNDSGW